MIVGIIATLLAFFFFQVVVLFLSRFTKRGFYDMLPFLHPGDAGAGYLQELFNSPREAALAHALGRKQFRKAQIKRIRLALEWLRRRAGNAGNFQEWAASEARKTGSTLNLEVRAAAEELEETSAQYRLVAGVIQRQLQRWLLQLIFLPFAPTPLFARLKIVDSFDLLQGYEKIEEAAVTLARACGGDYYDLLTEVL